MRWKSQPFVLFISKHSFRINLNNLAIISVPRPHPILALAILSEIILLLGDWPYLVQHNHYQPAPTSLPSSISESQDEKDKYLWGEEEIEPEGTCAL